MRGKRFNAEGRGDRGGRETQSGVFTTEGRGRASERRVGRAAACGRG